MYKKVKDQPLELQEELKKMMMSSLFKMPFSSTENDEQSSITFAFYMSSDAFQAYPNKEDLFVYQKKDNICILTLQNVYFDLMFGKEAFSILLLFNNEAYRLIVPFDDILYFQYIKDQDSKPIGFITDNSFINEEKQNEKMNAEIIPLKAKEKTSEKVEGLEPIEGNVFNIESFRKN